MSLPLSLSSNQSLLPNHSVKYSKIIFPSSFRNAKHIDYSKAKGKKVDASQEMIAIGTSNILGSLASSFPVTGSFSRTAVNASSGARTPFGGLYTGNELTL